MIGKKSILGFFAIYLAYHLNQNKKIIGETVTTKSGKIQGIVSLSRDGREFYEWLGIPYAKAPVGELRFQSPQPVEKWKGVREAAQYGDQCTQIEWFTNTPLGAEDCLYLNVHIPKGPYQLQGKKKGKLLPVMVWIHGGYFVTGSSQDYRPDYFMDEDVVIVTVNYRLGIFGFLSTNDETIRGNMGLKDQSLALRWIKDNIGSFGGNPEEITVMGESAGGVSTYLQMVSPMSKGLFVRGISQSASPRMPHYFHDDPLAQAKFFAKNVGCPATGKDEMIQCLRTMDAGKLLEGHKRMRSPERLKIDVIGPVIEKVQDKDTFLGEHPEILVSSGKVPALPWMTGVTSDEGAFYTVDLYRNDTFRKRFAENWDIVENSQLALPGGDAKLSSQIRKFYFGKDLTSYDPLEESTFDTFVKMCSDRYFLNPCHKSVGLHSQKAPVYTYWYSKEGPTIIDVFLAMRGENHPLVDIALYTLHESWNINVLGKARKYMGVAHADEIAMQFIMPSVFHVPTNSPYYEFSKAFVKTWVSFGKGEHPEFKGKQLPKITNNTKDITYLEVNDEPKVISYPHPERYQFWDKLNLI